jgi:hypothetical protein
MALSDILYNEILRMRDKRIAKEERMLTAQILVNKVLLGFINDWKSYSAIDQFLSNKDAQYMEFIRIKKRLEYHVDQFVSIATEISSINLLPNEVPTKLLEFAARMIPMIERSIIVSNDAWGREYPDSLPNQLDELLIEIDDMSQNLDKYCSIV